MVGCLNFSLVEYYQRRLQVMYRACGLESRLVDLEDGTIMKCWIPQRNKERAISLSSTHKPPLVLIHAFGSSANSWSYQVKPFAKFFDLYIPDLVFFGDSTTSRTERSEFFQAECVVKMLEQLSVPKYSVIGTSYGGFVAYRMAHMHPDSVHKLVVSSSGVIMDSSSNEELIKKYNVGDIKDILLPTDVEAMRRVTSLAFHKQLPFPVPRFIMEDYLEVCFSSLLRNQRAFRCSYLMALASLYLAKILVVVCTLI
jgi:pimeloyl-ACP methyl ester carboxylesterase